MPQTPSNHAIRISIATLALAATFLPSPSALACDAVDVETTTAACGSVLAVSLTGDASGADCRGVVSCVSASGTGNATNDAAGGSCGDLRYANASAGCVAASGTGDATNHAASCGVAGTGSSTAQASVGCVAASGGGDATNEAGECGYAGTSPAMAVAIGCVAASGTGNATNHGATLVCGYSHGVVDTVAAGCLALSGAGDAANRGDAGAYCGQSVGPTGLTVAVGCVAASGAGDASNGGGAATSCGASRAVEWLTVAAGCIAASGAGSAQNGPDPVCGETALPQIPDHVQYPPEAVSILLSCIAA